MDSLSSLSSLSEEEAPRRTIPDRINLWDKYDGAEFVSRFRFPKRTLAIILEKIGHCFEPTTQRSKALDSRTQLLIALRFYATGSFQEVLGDLVACDKATICRTIQKVTRAIASLARMYIKMPTQQECQSVAEEFYELAGFPRVIGTIDCTHIKINSPGGPMAECYRCRKAFFSINVQIVSDAKLKIRNIIARWPGSVHDSTIFNNSPLCAELEHGHYQGLYLLGDSGYFCKSFLLTPILNPQSVADENYNKSHITTRNTVERCIGVWKRRFPCIHKGITLRKMDTILKVIVATAVLHNLAVELEEEEPMSDLNIAFDTTETVLVHGHHDFSVRTSLINTVFNL